MRPLSAGTWLALLLAACGEAQAPDAPGASAPPTVNAPSRPRRRHAPDIRTCTACRFDDLDVMETMEGGDACAMTPPPEVRVAGRLLDAAGAPVKDGRLRFWSRESIKNATTDGDGAFELVADLEEFDYDVDLVVGEPAAGRGPGVRVHAGFVTAGDADVVLRTGIAPHVVAQGVLVDEDDRPLARWRIEARDLSAESEQVDYAWTDSAGRFSVRAWTDLRPTFHAAGPWGRPRPLPGSVLDATAQTHVSIGPSSISGRVVVEDDGRVAGATVRLRRIDDGVERTAAVDAAGDFVFDRAARGVEYELIAELAGYVCLQKNTCDADTQDTRLYLTAPQQIIEGRALDPSGDGLSSTWLRFVPVNGGPDAQTTTDFDGAFRVTVPAAGDYDVCALVPGEGGRSVPGPALVRCRGGEKDVVVRIPR